MFEGRVENRISIFYLLDLIYAMKIGLVGLPSVGKTTLFNLLTGTDPDTTDYSRVKVEGTLGMAKVPDES